MYTHESQLDGVSETQLYWLDSGQLGTPVVISSLNGPVDMRGLESWQIDKLIESDIMLHNLTSVNLYFLKCPYKDWPTCWTCQPILKMSLFILF